MAPCLSSDVDQLPEVSRPIFHRHPASAIGRRFSLNVVLNQSIRAARPHARSSTRDSFLAWLLPLHELLACLVCFASKLAFCALLLAATMVLAHVSDEAVGITTCAFPSTWPLQKDELEGMGHGLSDGSVIVGAFVVRAVAFKVEWSAQLLDRDAPVVCFELGDVW